jgi:hypothetical protein
MPETEARPTATNRHGGAPKGARPTLLDAGRFASARACRVMACPTGCRCTRAPVGAPPTPQGGDSISKTRAQSRSGNAMGCLTSEEVNRNGVRRRVPRFLMFVALPRIRTRVYPSSALKRGRSRINPTSAGGHKSHARARSDPRQEVPCDPTGQRPSDLSKKGPGFPGPFFSLDTCSSRLPNPPGSALSAKSRAVIRPSGRAQSPRPKSCPMLPSRP